MLDHFPRKIIIVGGGTAGWLAAAYLDRTYNTPARRAADILVVESPEIGRIGVAESTLDGLRNTMAFLGISETDLGSRTDATLTHGIHFEDWSRIGATYFHPLESFANLGFPPAGRWLARRLHEESGRFVDETVIQARVAQAGLSPKRMMDPDYQGAFPYAYQVDAESFADLLAEVAQSRGCRRLEAHVVGVEMDGPDGIAALTTEAGERIEGDLFIDCSGFASLLISKALGTPFVSYADTLLCDRAIAIRAPYDGEVSIPPMSRTRALDSGWMWRIGLRHGEGVGYVYSSAHLDSAAAEETLRREAGLSPDLPAHHQELRVGRSERSWVGNCVALGLASGFVEPLESTGIHMIEVGLQLLVRYFPLSGINPAARDTFNRELQWRYEELRDFIVAHYCLSQRDDTPFWREVRKQERRPPSLQQRLALWSDRPPGVGDIVEREALFVATNWQQIIYGMEWTPRAAMENCAFWLPGDDRHIPALAEAFGRARQDLPSHDLWLSGIPEPDAPLA